MYWGQIATALAVALAVGYRLLSTGRSTGVAVAAAVVAYVVVRWAIAWVYRVRYWYRRGTRNIHHEYCPRCSSRRHRYGGDWILQCKRCGWRPGLPVLRWVTRSVPARQLRRTVVGPKLVGVVLAVAVVASGGAGGLSTAVSLPADPVPTTDTEPVPAAEDPTSTVEPTPTSVVTPTAEPTPTPTATPADESDLVRAEKLILQRTNTIREERELQTVDRTACLDEFALKHSIDMAEHGYEIRHGGPNGTSWRDRASTIQGQCGGAVSENIAYGPAEGSVYIYGTSETTRLSTPSNIAEFAVRGWMNSQGHRENILDSRWSEVGIGVASNGENIYMTIIFS